MEIHQATAHLRNQDNGSAQLMQGMGIAVAVLGVVAAAIAAAPAVAAVAAVAVLAGSFSVGIAYYQGANDCGTLPRVDVLGICGNGCIADLLLSCLRAPRVGANDVAHRDPGDVDRALVSSTAL